MLCSNIGQTNIRSLCTVEKPLLIETSTFKTDNNCISKQLMNQYAMSHNRNNNMILLKYGTRELQNSNSILNGNIRKQREAHIMLVNVLPEC